MSDERIALDKKMILERYRALIHALDERSTAQDRRMVRRAVDLALDAHKGVRRKTGEPYVLHPLEVALIVLQEIGLGPTSATAAILHDVVEDSDYTLEDIERLFGEKIARIVDGLTKIKGVFDPQASEQAENFRKMLLTLGDDVRVILVKLADRLHNMRTLDGMPEGKQAKIASETLYIYAPLAHRLGLYNIKTELEDLSLKYTEPEVYRDIERRLKASVASEYRFLKRFSAPIRAMMEQEGLKFTLKERTKSISSIRKKMINQGVSFDEVYDKFAIRIILDTDSDQEKAAIWKVYSIVANLYRPNPERMRDWISSPKSNGYESLHTTVMGQDGHWVEVQIRSRRMDEQAELGMASHWKYKEEEVVDNRLESWIKMIREALESPDSNALEFVDDFKFNLFSDDIFVFTPKGEIKTLPKGSSPLDFSFEIHTDIGLRTLGAKVNGKLVQLNYKLRSGDQVEIITSAKQKPKEEWLHFVVTSKARTKIRASLQSERRSVAERGREILERKLNFVKVKPSEKVLQDLTNFMELPDSQELFYQAGMELLDNEKLRAFAREQGGGFLTQIRNRWRRPANDARGEAKTPGAAQPTRLVFGPEEQALEYKLSPCCNPIPGDAVFGFLTASEGIKVHRTDCPNAIALRSRFASRVMSARWISAEVSEFVAVLRVRGIDTVGLVNKVTQIISNDLNVNIRSINIHGEGGLFEGSITVVVGNKVHLQNIMQEIRKVDGVRSVERHVRE
ncbi:RelA/SpoT family protein [bacterium]|nr:RelA/SpoT family protein [bacterium]